MNPRRSFIETPPRRIACGMAMEVFFSVMQGGNPRSPHAAMARRCRAETLGEALRADEADALFALKACATPRRLIATLAPGLWSRSESAGGY